MTRDLPRDILSVYIYVGIEVFSTKHRRKLNRRIGKLGFGAVSLRLELLNYLV